jgi:malonyl-CoA O-methyltransferase
MALQWSRDLPNMLSNLYNTLFPNGLFAFSIPITGTFIELPTNSTFYCFNYLYNLLSENGFNILKGDIHEETFRFNSIFEALQSIKKVGANYVANHDTMQSSLLGQLIKHRKQPIQLPFSLTYKIGIFITTKRVD